jgi:hypothetical protein
MGIVNIGFDIVLIGVAIWMIMIVRNSGLGGVMGATLTNITIGGIVLGIAHLLETLTFAMIKLEDVAVYETIHRVIVLVGFVFLILGMQGLSKLRRPN